MEKKKKNGGKTVKVIDYSCCYIFFLFFFGFPISVIVYI